MAAPEGNQNAAKAKRWTAAIERALSRKATGKQPEGERSDLMIGIDEAADAFVAQLFENKDLGSFKELGDRIEGKAAQTLAVDADVRTSMVQATPLDEGL